MGFWLTNDIEVGSQGKADRQSDLTQLLGIRFDGMFTPARLVAECGERESRSDTDRILRLHGLSQYLSARDTLFIRPKVHPNCRSLASKLNIRIIDEDALTQLEVNQARSPLCEELTYDNLTFAEPDAGKTDEETRTQILQLDRYLSYGFWSVEFYRNLFILVEMYSARREIFRAAMPWAAELAFRGAERFALCLLEMARSVISRDPGNLHKLSRTYLHGGPLALRDKEKFFSLLRELTGTAEQADPAWLNEQLELLARMLCHPTGASDVLRYLSVMRILQMKRNPKISQNAFGPANKRSGMAGKKRKQSKSVLILPGEAERDVCLILPSASNGTSKNGSVEHVDPDEMFENVEAIILAKQTAWTFCKITGIEPEIFSSLSMY